MIIRLIALDPNPREGKSDVLVYQIPEHSREFEVLVALFDQAAIEWTTIMPAKKPINL